MSDNSMRPYATILLELRLPAKQMTFLKELIVERAQSSGDSEALSKDVRLNPTDTALARSEAEAAFDGDITEAVGGSNAERILQMLSLEPQLAEIDQTVGSDSALIDEPLTGEQTLELARAYRDIYAEPSPGSDRLDGFDPQTGLATADKKLVARAKAFLTSTQAAILRINLARITSAYFRSQD